MKQRRVTPGRPGHEIDPEALGEHPSQPAVPDRPDR
jgi:hypothetical protein